MLKKFSKTGWLLLLSMIMLFTISSVTLAGSATNVVISKEQHINRDKFVWAQMFQNEGVIKGDLFVWAQNINSTGTVVGDILGMGQEFNLAGSVLGNIRTVGGTINLAGNIGKNVNVFGGVLNLADTSVIGGNLLAFCGQVTINGKVKGHTSIFAGKVVLNGEFFGDVDVHTDFKHNRHFFGNDEKIKTSLTVLPGTIIHGKLTYRGMKADIQKGAQIASYHQVRSRFSAAELQQQVIHKTIWKFVRLIFGAAVYFLIALLLYRLFPVFFKRQGELISQKPLNMLGYGLVTIFSTIITLIVCIILLLLSILISPVFGLIFGLTSVAIYLLLFFFSIIPVAQWLGNLLTKENLTLPYRFGIGLATFTLGLFILALLAKLPMIGPIFHVFSFLIKFGAILLGTGTLLAAFRDSYQAAKK